MKDFVKTLTRGGYDIQKLRIMMGNRLVGNFKAKLGQTPSEKEDVMDKKGQELLKSLRLSYRKITDGVTRGKLPTAKKFKGDELISSYTELCLVDRYMALEVDEAMHFKMIGFTLKDYPIYTEFLEKVKGCGPAMAGVIISEIDITKSKYASSLWAYCGLDVAGDGKGRSRRKEHLRLIEYQDKDDKPATRNGITFNPFLKTKLMGVLASSFLRAGKDDNKYAQIYYDYKNRLETNPRHQDKSKGHRHNMALRYMVKRFLVDLYEAWRPLEGLKLEVYEEYSVGKLGMQKHTG